MQTCWRASRLPHRKKLEKSIVCGPEEIMRNGIRDVMTGEPTDFAAEQQRRFDASTTADDRKERGHFGTPPVIAEFMAGMFSDAHPSIFVV